MRRLITGLLVMTSVLAAESPELLRFEHRAIQMGMEVRIVQYAPDPATSRAAATAAFDRIDALENVFSTFRRNSEISRLNDASPGTSVPVSEELYEVIERAVEMSRLSEGAFDVTIGSMMALWRSSRDARELPTSAELAAAREASGWEAIDLDPESRTVRLVRPGIRLDLGGIAKGYILDAALQVLREHGIESALIEAGGDLRLSAPPPGLEGWRVAVPVAPGETTTLHLSDVAVSTSGDLEQFVDIDGERYSHIIDPRTGLGATTRVLATVIARDAFTSDPVATALTILEAEQGARLADEAGVRAFYVVRGD